MFRKSIRRKFTRTITLLLIMTITATSLSSFAGAAASDPSPQAISNLLQTMALASSDELTLEQASQVAPPILLPISSLTNQSNIEIKGNSEAGTAITLYHSYNGGQQVPIGEQTADETGTFTLSAAMTQNGLYQFTATAAKGGEISSHSAPIQTTLDTTPPNPPAQVSWSSSNYDRIALQWDAPTGEAVQEYVIRKNEQTIQTTASVSYTDLGLTEGSEAVYEILSKDEAGNMSEPVAVNAFTLNQGAQAINTTPMGEASDGNVDRVIVSDNGSVAVFSYTGKDINTGEGTDHSRSLYAKDLSRDELMKIASNEDELNYVPQAISKNGQIIVYKLSGANDQLYWVDRSRPESPHFIATTILGVPASITADGSKILFLTYEALTDEDNDFSEQDMYIYNVSTNSFQLIQSADPGYPGPDNAVISGDGNTIAYVANNNSRDVYLYDLLQGTSQFIASNASYPAVISISKDGRYVGYGLISNDNMNSLHVYDHVAATSTQISAYDYSYFYSNLHVTSDGSGITYSVENETGKKFYSTNMNTLETKSFAGAETGMASAGTTKKVVFVGRTPSMNSNKAAYQLCLTNCESVPPTGEPIQTANWEAPLQSGQADLGSTLVVNAVGALGNSSSIATIQYRRYLPDQTLTEETAVIQLAESSSTAGSYSGGFELAEGIAEILSISVHGEGLSGNTADLTLDRFPLKVGGELRVELDDLSAVDGPELLAFSASKNVVRQVPVEGNVVSLKLPSAEDYTLMILDSHHVMVGSAGPVSVLGGLINATHPEFAMPAGLTVTVNGENYEPLPQVQLTVQQTENNEFITTGRTGTDGRVYFFLPGMLNKQVKIKVKVPVPYESIPEQTLMLERNSFIHLDATVQRGSVYGRVVTENGYPVARREVTITQPGIIQTVQTDSDGNYDVPVVMGHSTISTYDYSMRNYIATTEVDVNGRMRVDLALQWHATGNIKVNVWNKPKDGEWTQLNDDIVMRDYLFKVFRNSDQEVRSFPRAGGTIQVYGVESNAVLQVCAKEKYRMTGYTCQNVQLDDASKRGEVTYRFGETAKVTGNLLYNPDTYSYGKASVYKLDDQGRRTGSSEEYRIENNFSLGILTSGKYEIEFTAVPKSISGSYGRAKRVIEVSEQEVISLGVVEVKTGYFQNPYSNQLLALTRQVSANETVSLRGTYFHSGQQVAYSPELILSIPSGTELVEGSVMVNGQPQASVQETEAFYKVAIEDVAPLDMGSVTYRLRITNGDQAFIQPELSIRHGRISENWEIIDSERISVVSVTLDAPRLVAKPNIYVEGHAPNNSKLWIYDGSQLVGETTSSVSGFWSATVNLADNEGYPVHALVAKAVGENGEQHSNTEHVTYDPEAPQPVELTLKRSGAVKIVDISGGAPHFPFIVDGQPVYYSVKFNYPEKVENVRIFEDNNEVPAALNPATNQYESIQQDGMTDYGDIYIDYDVKPEPYEAQTNEELYNSLPPEIRNEYHAEFGEPSYSDENGHFVSGSIKSRDNNEIVKFRLQVKPLQDYQMPPVPDGTPRIYEPSFSISGEGDTLKITASVIAPVDSNIQSSMKAMGINIAEAPPAAIFGVTLESSAAGLGQILGQFYLLDGYVDKIADLDALERQVNSNSCLTPGAQRMFLSRIETAKEDVFISYSANTILLLMAGIAPATGPLAPFVLLYAAVGGFVSYQMGKKLDSEIGKVKNRIDEETRKCVKPGDDGPAGGTPSARPNRIFDPSGYVYEAVPSNRVEGVKATVMQKVGSEWEPWNAEWYEQQNPQTTNREGKYGWDVPEGIWQVLYEKDGYELARSAELTVLPPHYDVNIPIVSRKAPEVESVYTVQQGSEIQVDFSKYVQVDDLNVENIMVKRNGQSAYQIVPINPEKDAANRDLAISIRIVPDASAPFVDGEQVLIRIAPTVLSYAEVPMVQPFETTITVQQNAPAPNIVTDAKAIPDFNSIGTTWNETADSSIDAIRIYWKAANEDTEHGPVELEKGTGVHSFAAERDIAYTIRWTSVSKSGVESEGVTLEARTLPDPYANDDEDAPSEVTELQLSQLADGLNLKWTDPTEADFSHVSVYMNKAGDTENVTKVTVAKGTGEYTFQNMESGTYEIKVTTVDETSNESTGVNEQIDLVVIPVTGVELEPSELIIKPGDSPSQLVPTVLPVDATNKDVYWSSSDPSVASVDGNGFVTPVSPGEATITVITENGLNQAQTLVKVQVELMDLYLEGEAGRDNYFFTLIPDEKKTLKVMAQFKGSEGAKEVTPFVTVKIDRPEIVSFENGDLKALKEGQAFITVSYQDRSFTISVNVISPIKFEVILKKKDYNAFDGALNLRIPEGSVPPGTKITAYRSETASELPTESMKLRSFVYTLESGERPGKGVELTLNYDKSGLKGSEHLKLGIYRYNLNDPNKWIYVGGITDPAKGQIRTGITEWGTYAVFFNDL